MYERISRLGRKGTISISQYTQVSDQALSRASERSVRAFVSRLEVDFSSGTMLVANRCGSGKAAQM